MHRLLPLAAALTAASCARYSGPIIDGHVHVTNTSLFTYQWANASAGVCPCAPPCLCDWDMSDWQGQVGGSALPATAFVFVEVNVLPAQYADEAVWVQSLSSPSPASSPIRRIIAAPPVGFGTPNATSEEIAQALDDLVASAPLTGGVRPGVDWGDAANLQYLVAHTQLLAQRGLVMDINAPMGSNASANVVNLVAAVPNAIFILDHIGGAPVTGGPAAEALWKAQLQALSALPNVYCKVSGVLQEYKSTGVLPTEADVAPWVTFAITTFGYNRCLFAGNWFFVNWLTPPLLNNYRTWAEYLMQIVGDMGATQADMEALFYRTAAAAYSVSLPSAGGSVAGIL